VSTVGDNIANSNTTGYKAGRVEFADLLAEGGEGRASEANPAVGKAGNGVEVADVRLDHSTGTIEFTGRSLDAAIDGKGFFSVGDPSAPNYSRDGTFSVNGAGQLINSSGQPILGFAPGATTLSEIDLANAQLAGTETTEAAFFGNISASDENAPLLPANPATFREIDSNANFSSSLTVYDSLGARHELTLAFFKTDTNTWVAQAYADGADVGGEAGIPVQVGANTTLNFGGDGEIPEANLAEAVMNVTPAWSNGANGGNFTLDLSRMTQFGSSTVASAITQNGSGVGEIIDYEIQSDGGFYLLLNGGTSALVGTLQLTNFQNQDALDRIGGGLFATTGQEGTVITGNPGTGGLGEVRGAALELSNVDTAGEFTDLILYQRGYQASSKTFSTVDDMLRDTLNIVR
jgi:flagellar hook protein FlgE